LLRTQRTISPLLYFILVSSLTNLTFLIAGIALLAPFSVNFSSAVLQIIIILLLWKGVLVGLVSWLIHKKANNKDFLVMFIGMYLGRFLGILIGGFLGARILNSYKQPEIFGIIVGALAVYFVGRWIGAKVSIQIGRQVDKVFYIKETQEAGNTLYIKFSNKFASLAFIVYGVILPLLFVFLGLMINYIQIPINYHTEFLPISRVIVIVLSILTICLPWLFKNRWLNKYHAMKSPPESVFYWLGLTFSIFPVIYGFILFMAIGISIIELCLYAAVGSISAIIWTMNYKITLKKTVG
jgi:hypothetical protein